MVLEVRKLRQELETGSCIEARLVCRSPAIERLRGQVLALADTDVDVLLVGETGSGKEVVARALHDFGGRRAGAFVAITCGALPAEITESALFYQLPGPLPAAQKPPPGHPRFAHGHSMLPTQLHSNPPHMLEH